MIGRVSELFQKMELTASKTKAPTEKRFMTVRQLLILKSRLKTKPRNTKF
jgi:hypothetical protein